MVAQDGSRQSVLRLAGEPPAVAACVDRILISFEPHGIVEADGHCELGFHDPDREAIVRGWSGIAAGLSVSAVWRRVDPADAATGRERDVVIDVVPGLRVRAPWVEAPPMDGIELVVPRGGAFGSGEHASTRLALTLLHRHWPVESGGLRFADVGCGSGILALYACRRGCATVQACDVDPAAVRAATELLELEVCHGGPSRLEAADLVVANLDDGELERALPELVALWSGRSGLLLSGARGEFADRLARSVGLARAGVQCRDRLAADGFVAQWFA